VQVFGGPAVGYVEIFIHVISLSLRLAEGKGSRASGLLDKGGGALLD
jgi:hypothetical protein